MSESKKRLGKSHWRESRLGTGNLNQKSGPMSDGKEEKLERARKKDIADELRCGSCGVEITHTDIACQEGLCDICFEDEFGNEYSDTLEEPRLPDASKPLPGPATYTIFEDDEEEKR